MWGIDFFLASSSSFYTGWRVRVSLLAQLRGLKACFFIQSKQIKMLFSGDDDGGDDDYDDDDDDDKEIDSC